jgi:GDP-L-fucose synthase
MEKLKDKKFLITGGSGFLGKNLVKYITENGGIAHGFGSEFDLTKEDVAMNAFKKFNEKYDYIIHAAAVQGAGEWPAKHKAESFSLNNKIHTNVLECWYKYQPQARLIGIGSTCAYPAKMINLKENEYWDGPMHESVDVYGMTKKLMYVGISAYKSQYGLKGTTATFATLYGAHDSFDLEKAHVVSALIKKFVDAKDNNLSEVEVWGDGYQTRELIYVEDQIKGLMSVLDYDGDLINIGAGVSHTIRELAETIKEILDYKGNIFYNTNRFVGVKHKTLDISIAKENYGWTNKIKLGSLRENLIKTINWYTQNKNAV